MKKEDFDAFLMNAIEDDKRNIGCDEQNFDVMYNRLRKHQKNVDSQKKMINYGVLPVLMMVVALNMFDQVRENGDELDFHQLGILLGAPMVPTVSRSGEGIEQLFEQVIDVYEYKSPVARHIHVNHGSE